jgi:hypothetical protein
VVHKVALGRVNAEDGAEALKHVGVLIKYFNIYVCAFIRLNNKYVILFSGVTPYRDVFGLL